MNAVERVIEYTKLTPEKPPIVAAHRPPKGWPSQGVVEVQDLVVRYREDLDPVLKHISFKTRPHEKIGVVGRTGVTLQVRVSSVHPAQLASLPEWLRLGCSHSNSKHQSQLPLKLCVKAHVTTVSPLFQSIRLTAVLPWLYTALSHVLCAVMTQAPA